MQKLRGLPPLTSLNARQNDLFSAFDFQQALLPAPAPPVAPPDSLGFHAPGGILTNISEPAPGKPVSINLEPETPGLSLDSGVNGGTGWATVDVGTTPATAPPQ